MFTLAFMFSCFNMKPAAATILALDDVDGALLALDVAVDDEGAFVDVDTPEDYVQVFGRAPGGGVRGPS